MDEPGGPENAKVPNPQYGQGWHGGGLQSRLPFHRSN